MNPAVIGIDVVDRKVEAGVLRSHRLITSEWCLPHWAARLLGADKTCFASEHSEVDPSNRTMTLTSRNVRLCAPCLCVNSLPDPRNALSHFCVQLTFCNELSVMEKLTYSPHPTESNTTLLRQEAVITVHGIPLSSYIESFISSTISANANKVSLLSLCLSIFD